MDLNIHFVRVRQLADTDCDIDEMLKSVLLSIGEESSFMESVPLASIMIEEVFRFQSITATITTFRIAPIEYFVFTKSFHTISKTISKIREAPFSFLALKYGV